MKYIWLGLINAVIFPSRLDSIRLNGESTVNCVTVLGPTVNWIPLDVKITVPSHGFERTPMLVEYHLQNKSQIMHVDVSIEGSETFMFARMKLIFYNFLTLKTGNHLPQNKDLRKVVLIRMDVYETEGPMVYGTAFCPINNVAQLESLECADSKVLTEEKRDKIFENICNASARIGWGVEVISPTSICNSMLSRRKYSLNQVSMDSAIKLIRSAIDAGVKVEHVYVDTVGKPEKYQAYLESIFPGYKITVAKKADSTYSIVSAASICAKVSRDHALQVWDFQEGIKATVADFGSGYPGDPVTKKFLVDYCDPVFGYPQLVRFSWSTAEKALEQMAYHVEWEDIEKEVKKPKNTTAITSFLMPSKSDGKGKRKQHTFFARRCLQPTKEL